MNPSSVSRTNRLNPLSRCQEKRAEQRARLQHSGHDETVELVG